MATEPSRQTLDTNGRRLDGDRPGQDINMFATARTVDDFSTPPNFFGLPVAASVATSTGDFDQHDDTDEDGDPGDRPKTPHRFPFVARNAFFAERRASFDTSTQIAEATARQADAQLRTNTTLRDLRGMLVTRFDELNNRLRAIDTTIGSVRQEQRDDVVAIYALGFGPHGGVSQHSDAGVWIRRAWPNGAKIDQPTICDLANLTRKDKDKFAATLAETRNKHEPLVAGLSDPDLRRFLALLPEVCRAIGAQPPADPPPDPTPIK